MKTLICAVASSLLTPLVFKDTNKDVFLGIVPWKPNLLWKKTPARWIPTVLEIHHLSKESTIHLHNEWSFSVFILCFEDHGQWNVKQTNKQKQLCIWGIQQQFVNCFGSAEVVLEQLVGHRGILVAMWLDWTQSKEQDRTLVTCVSFLPTLSPNRMHAWCPLAPAPDLVLLPHSGVAVKWGQHVHMGSGV